MSDILKWALAHQAEITGGIVALLAFFHSLVLAIKLLAKALRGLAKLTASKADDAALDAAEHWALRAEAALKRAEGFVPRVSIGPRKGAQ